MSTLPNSSTVASHQTFEILGDHHVGDDGQRPPAAFTDLGDRRVEIRPGPGGGHDVGPGVGEAEGDAPPDASSRTGDDGDLVGEQESIEEAHGFGLSCSAEVGGCPARVGGKVQVALDARVGRHHVGDRADAVGGGGHHPRVAGQSGGDGFGVPAVEGDPAGGSPVTSTSNRSPSGPKVQAGSRWS